MMSHIGINTWLQRRLGSGGGDWLDSGAGNDWTVGAGIDWTVRAESLHQYGPQS